MRLFFILVAAAAVALAGSVSARADFIPGSVSPIDASACPGFAQVYPAGYVFSGNLDFGGVGAGEWIAPATDQGAISFTGNDGRWMFKIRGLTAPGEAPQFDLSTPPLTAFAAFTYTINGEFSGPQDPNSIGQSGTGELRITRSDGARMWGKASIFQSGVGGPQWFIGFSSSDVHCS